MLRFLNTDYASVRNSSNKKTKSLENTIQNNQRRNHMNGSFMKLNTISFFIALAVILCSGVSFSTTNRSTIKINHYEFGKIVINENSYTKDIAIWPDGEIKTGPEDMHFMKVSDFNELFNSGLKKLVIGTGDEGKVRLDFGRKLEKALKDKGVELIMMDTHDIVKFLNETKERNFLVFVHLTC